MRHVALSAIYLAPLVFSVVSCGCKKPDKPKTELQKKIETQITQKIEPASRSAPEEESEFLKEVKCLAYILEGVAEENVQEATDALSIADHEIFLAIFGHPEIGNRARELSVKAIEKRGNERTTVLVGEVGETSYQIDREIVKLRIAASKDDSELAELEREIERLDHVKSCLEKIKGGQVSEYVSPHDQ